MSCFHLVLVSPILGRNIKILIFNYTNIIKLNLLTDQSLYAVFIPNTACNFVSYLIQFLCFFKPLLNTSA